jgi:peptidoglycan/LPS O-acetylase OafA/YrhL
VVLMPTNYPRDNRAPEPNYFGVLAVIALVLGAATLFLDHHSGATSHRGLLLVVGLASLLAAVVLGGLGTFSHRRPTPVER